MIRRLTFLLVLCILAAGLGANLWLRSERMRMDQREAALRESVSRSSGTEPEASASSLPDAKASEREKPALRDTVAFVHGMKEREERWRRGEIDGVTYGRSQTLADYAGAPVEELQALAAELQRSGLHPGMIRQLRQKIAHHLANIDPKASTRLALEDGDGGTFAYCLGKWIETDAKGALAWMDATDPPLSLSRFQEIGDLNLDNLRLVARLAIDPAGAELPPIRNGENFSPAYSKLPGTLSPPGMVTLLGRLKSASSTEPELPRLIANLIAGYADSQISLQILVDADLPAPLQAEVAARFIGYQDPPGARRAIEAYREATSGEARTQGVRKMVTTWSSSDRASAIGWVEAQPDSTEKAELRELAKNAPES